MHKIFPDFHLTRKHYLVSLESPVSLDGSDRTTVGSQIKLFQIMLPSMLKCANPRGSYMRKFDAERISTNLIFLEEKTINTEVLIEKLIDCQLLDDKDRIRISEVADYNRNLEVYLTVLRKGPQAFELLLQSLNQSGNEAVVDRLNPQTDFEVIWLHCRQHWPFTCIMLISQTCGCLYWMYRLYKYMSNSS